MKRTLAILLYLLIISTGSNAQCNFHRLYDNNNKFDFGLSVIETYDNGYVSCGKSTTPNPQSFIVKTDACGDALWTRDYDFTIPAGGFTGESILQLQDSNYVICGSFYDTIEGSATSFLLKLAKNGDTLWYKPVQGGFNDRGIDHKQTPDSGFIIGGYRNVLDSGILIIKTDDLGNIEWLKEYGDSLFDDVESIDFTSDSGYIIAGDFDNQATSSDDLYILKTDKLGNFQWRQYYGGAGTDGHGYAITTLDGGYCLVGYKEIAGDYQAYMVKTDSAGNIEWEKTYGLLTEPDLFKYVRQLSDSSYMVAGGINDISVVPAKPRVWLLKMNPQGDTLWSRTFTYYGGDTQDYVEDLSLTNDGGFVMTGYIINNALPQKNDLFLIRTDSLGRVCEYYQADIVQSIDTVYLSGNTTVQFNDTSICCVDWLWDFGDGDEDYIQNPSHTYDSAGVFTVTLIVSNGACSATDISVVVVINDIGIDENTRHNKIAIYPNPTTGKFTIQGATAPSLHGRVNEIQIFDLFGRLLLRSNKVEIDMSNYPSGLYVWQVGSARGKLVLE